MKEKEKEKEPEETVEIVDVVTELIMMVEEEGVKTGRSLK